MRNFYKEMSEKRENEPMRLQMDQKLILNKIKNLNKKYSVQVFSTNFRSGKTFDAEQKIRK